MDAGFIGVLWFHLPLLHHPSFRHDLAEKWQGLSPVQYQPAIWIHHFVSIPASTRHETFCIPDGVVKLILFAILHILFIYVHKHISTWGEMTSDRHAQHKLQPYIYGI